MEDSISDIERCSKLLRIIACSESVEENVGSALYLISNILGTAHERVDAKYGEAWHSTWGYVYGEGAAS